VSRFDARMIQAAGFRKRHFTVRSRRSHRTHPVAFAVALNGMAIAHEQMRAVLVDPDMTVLPVVIPVVEIAPCGRCRRQHRAVNRRHPKHTIIGFTGSLSGRSSVPAS